MKNLHSAKRSTEKSISSLRVKLNAAIDEGEIDLGDDDVNELEDICEEVDEIVSKDLTRDHFQRIFWEQQRKYNYLNNENNEVASFDD